MAIGRLGAYEILNRIGQGGMGVVFRARDTRLDRIVALKVLPEAMAEDSEYRGRLKREGRAEASLNHSNIATCFEIGEALLDPPSLLGSDAPPGAAPRTTLYLAVEYVPGEDLLTHAQRKRLKLPETLELAVQIASGLEAAHQKGVLHRDLKPSNILVTEEGQIKIVDFGLARIPKSAATPEAETTSVVETAQGRIWGTALYMSPEQALGQEVDARSDLFSFGVVLYQLVTNQFPFRGSTYLEILHSLANDEPEPLTRFASGVPDELERISRKLLAKARPDRYQSAHEALTDLRNLARGIGGGGRTQRLRRWRERRAPWITAVAAGVILAAIVALVIRWPGRDGSRIAAKGIAILPFLNATGDPGLDYLCDGLAAGILGSLVQGTDLNVVSHSTAWRFRGTDVKAPEVARELGVASILEGTVRKSAESIRVDVQLVDGRTGFAIWSGKFERPAGEILYLEDEIVQQVALTTSGRAAPGGQLAAERTRSLVAYECYLKAGRYLDDADNPRGPDLAAELYAKAIELDPKFALASAGWSRALWKLYNRDKEPYILRRAEAAADEAARLNPRLLEARVARAQIYRGTSRYAESIAELGAVLRINPNWDEVHLQLAATYQDAGFLARAEESYRHAVALRPGYWRTWNNLGALLIRKGDYDQARNAFRKVIELTPDKNRGYEQLAALETLNGRYDEAIRAYERLPAPVRDAALASNIGTAYFFAGRLDKAEEFYLVAVQLEPRNQIWWQNLGDLSRRRGRDPEAVEQYRKAVHLVEEQLALDPNDNDLGLQHAVYLAKAGECDAASRTLGALVPRLPVEDAEYAHSMAEVYALCGSREEAIEALRKAIRSGYSPNMIREEDEFRSLREHPQFILLTAGYTKNR